MIYFISRPLVNFGLNARSISVQMKIGQAVQLVAKGSSCLLDEINATMKANALTRVIPPPYNSSRAVKEVVDETGREAEGIFAGYFSFNPSVVRVPSCGAAHTRWKAVRAVGRCRNNRPSMEGFTRRANIPM